ncbi:MAG: hypothetical protein FWF90_15700 [Promicromonosporaceae bacterium]|nr:hypothetical protein [Promicromonosporaceae bacterium]
MALDTGRPDQPPRRYFAGPGYLAEVLYGPDGIERYDDGDPVPTASATRQVEKVLTELVRAGAARRVVTGGRRHRSEYELVIARPVDDAPALAASPTDSVGHSPTESVGTARPKRSGQPDRNGRPQETQRNQEEYQEDNMTPSATTDAHEADPSRHESSAGLVWYDVPLDLEDTTALYDAASTYLATHCGPARALDLVGARTDVGIPPRVAVIEAARAAGWNHQEHQ